MKKNKLFLAVLFSLGMIIYSNVNAAVINVPADEPTIQGAIDISQDGDTILIAPGIYKEDISVGAVNAQSDTYTLNLTGNGSGVEIRGTAVFHIYQSSGEPITGQINVSNISFVSPLGKGYGITLANTNLTFSACKISGYQTGLEMEMITIAKIDSSTITKCSRGMNITGGGHEIYLSSSVIKGNKTGINYTESELASSLYLEARENVFQNNGTAIYLFPSLGSDTYTTLVYGNNLFSMNRQDVVCSSSVIVVDEGGNTYSKSSRKS